MITAEKLRQRLHYEPLTGIFTWLINPNSGRRIGGVATTVAATGKSNFAADSIALTALLSHG